MKSNLYLASVFRGERKRRHEESTRAAHGSNFIPNVKGGISCALEERGKEKIRELAPAKNESNIFGALSASLRGAWWFELSKKQGKKRRAKLHAAAPSKHVRVLLDYWNTNSRERTNESAKGRRGPHMLTGPSGQWPGNQLVAEEVEEKGTERGEATT